jgi:hypothetical protein
MPMGVTAAENYTISMGAATLYNKTRFLLCIKFITEDSNCNLQIEPMS